VPAEPRVVDQFPSRLVAHVTTGFAAAIATAAFVTLDIEFPRLGLIRVDSFDRALIEPRSGMQ